MAKTKQTPAKVAQDALTASGGEPALTASLKDSTETHTGESAEASLDKLVTVVLDSAGIANRSASIAASSTESLLSTVDDLSKVTSRARMTSAIVLGVASLAIVAAAGALFTVSVQLSGRLTQTSATLLAVGKRAVEMNAGVENLKRIETALTEMANKQGSGQFEKLETKLDTALVEMRKPVAAAPAPIEKSSKQDDARHQSLLAQIKALEAQTQAQARSIARLSEQITSSRADVSKMMGVARSVETLVANINEKQRVVAAVQSAPVPRERERQPDPRSKEFIQYPGPQAEKTDRPRQTSATADPAAANR